MISGIKKPVTASFLLVIFLISGCTLYQRPKIAPVPTPCDFKLKVLVSNPRLKNHWWENFNDEELNKLVCLAIKNNLNYQVAIKNVQIAKTYVDQAASALLPQINLNYDASRNMLSANSFNATSFSNPNPSTNASNQLLSGAFNLEQLYLSATYELDVWNQVGNTINQAKANVMVSDADSDVIKLTLISNVVNTYFQITTLNATLANLRQQYCCACEFLQLTKDQYKAGLIDFGAVDDAKNQVETIKISIDASEKQREVAVNSLAYLLGIYPEDFRGAPCNKLKAMCFTKLIPAGIPCYMIANRPDVQEAYYQIVSYGYLEKQNIANFLPSFNLTGIYGFASIVLSQFLTKGSIFWNYGVNVLQPVFDYGLRMSEYNRSKLQFESAFLSYKNAIISAFNDVDSALASYEGDYKALRAYENQLANMRDKLNLADAQFQAGLTDYTADLTVQINYLQASYNVVNQRLAVLQDVIALYKALGLGLCV